MAESDKDTLATIQRGFTILEWIHEHDGGTTTEIADGVGISSSTAHRYLRSLREDGYLVKENDSHYLALKFLALGEQARTRKETYTDAKEYTDMLAEETGCRSTFVVEESNQGIYLYTSPGNHSVWTRSTIGKRIPLHATAAGKAILAFLPDERIDEIIDEQPLEQKTAQTITSPQQLRNELETVQDRGYAFNTEEQIEAVNAVGAPVTNKSDEVIGAFSVSGPSNRLSGERFKQELPNSLLGIANEYELRVALS